MRCAMHHGRARRSRTTATRQKTARSFPNPSSRLTCPNLWSCHRVQTSACTPSRKDKRINKGVMAGWIAAAWLAPRARITGAVYLLYFLTAVLAQFFTSRKLVVYGDAVNLIAYAFYIALTLLFYCMFKPVNKSRSLLAAFFSLMGCTIGVLQIFHLAPSHISPLWFFGPYCLLIGYLIIRSTFLPRSSRLANGVCRVGLADVSITGDRKVSVSLHRGSWHPCGSIADVMAPRKRRECSTMEGASRRGGSIHPHMKPVREPWIQPSQEWISGRHKLERVQVQSVVTSSPMRSASPCAAVSEGDYPSGGHPPTKGRIHVRRPFTPTSFFACKTAADHTCRVGANSTGVQDTGENSAFHPVIFKTCSVAISAARLSQFLAYSCHFVVILSI